MKRVLLPLLLLATVVANAQDSLYIRQMVDTLASPYFWGRGYTKDGMHKAAEFIAQQVKNDGLLPMDGKDYFQHFTYSFNTFPGKMSVAINGIQLQPGVDFIVAPESRGLHATGTLIQQDSIHFVDPLNRIIVLLQNKLTWDGAQQTADYTGILLDENRFKGIPAKITADIDNKLEPKFDAANVCSYIKGTVRPDSFIIITAHYDHFGGMGSDTYFPGANDNASGTSVLLALERYYAAHPQPYSMGFISFAGEEPGLLGSKYFTEHPLVPLNQIRFLLNIDMEGTGIDGITVVNATEFPKEFQYMQDVNGQGHYLAAVNSRGKAHNSDHYYFTEKGVPSFFFYTLGGIRAYHDVFDRSETLPLNKVNDITKFIEGFNAKLMGHK